MGASLYFISLPVLKRGKAGLGLEVLAQQAAAAKFQFRGNLSNTLVPVYESYLDFGNDRLVNEFLCCTTSGFLDRNAQIMIADAKLVGEPSYIPVPPGSLTNQCFYLLPLSLVMVSSIEKRDGSGRSRISIQTLWPYHLTTLPP